MTLPPIPQSTHVYVGATGGPLHLYTLEQMLQFQRDTVEACAALEALKAQQVAVPMTILERARTMYAEFPTYHGTKPVLWGNVGNDVRREWLDKAKSQQAAAPYDQQAMEPCLECGWKAIMPGEPCFVCNMHIVQEQITDEQARAIYDRLHPFNNNVSKSSLMDFVRAIEAHHGITPQGDTP